MSEKYMYFNGLRFTRDDSTGYYLSSRKTKGNTRQRMHVYVWEYYNGPVPVLHHAEMVENLKKNAVPKSRRWHGTDAGKAWHKNHYEQMKDRLYVEHNFICQNCGKEYKSVQMSSKFCSNNCKSAWRKKSGVDDIIRNCKCCGKGFVVNKYAKKEYCSKECASKTGLRAGKIS